MAGSGYTWLLVLRLSALGTCSALLVAHMRSLRVFWWERAVGGGAGAAGTVAAAGLALCEPAARPCGPMVRGWLAVVPGALLAVNAAALWTRWRSAGELTRVVAEMLGVLGVPLRRQLVTKVVLSMIAATAFTAAFILDRVLYGTVSTV